MKIHLHLYTGRPDPQWEISDPEVRARIRSWRKAVQNGPAPTPFLTGYRGCEITDGNERYVIYRDGISTPEGWHAVGAPGIEDQVIETNPYGPALRKRVARARSAANTLVPIVNVPVIDPASIDGTSAPAFQPDRWNANWEVRGANTCFSYANNVITENIVTLFRADSDMTGYAIGESLLHDGLQPLGQTLASPPPAHTHIVAAVVQLFDDDSGDHHFFRLDANRIWSHKSGGKDATNRDDRGELIRDLSQAKFRTAYTLIGFFLSTPESRAMVTERDGLPPLPAPTPEPQVLS